MTGMLPAQDRFQHVAIEGHHLTHGPQVHGLSVTAGEHQLFANQNVLGGVAQRAAPSPQLDDAPHQARGNFVDKDAADDVQGTFVGIASAVDKPGGDARLIHGPVDSLAAAMHQDRLHAHRFQEDQISEQAVDGFGLVEGAAPIFDDDVASPKPPDPAQRFDEDVGFANGFFHRVSARTKKGSTKEGNHRF